MTASQATALIQQMFWSAFWISLPLLGIGLIAGVLVSLVQIVTSIQDTSFSAAPRLLAFLAGLLFLLPWMLSRLLSYTTSLLGDFSPYVK